MNNSDVVTYTGFIQYFTKYGPISSLDSKLPGPSYCPIKIIPISTSMINKLFMVYTTDSGEHKLIYE
jgi:hypothetical protein